MCIISTKNLHKTYTSERGMQVKALQNIDLEIKNNEFLCLLGESGCGKSTLLHLIAGLLKPTSGQIEVLGKPLTAPISEAQMVFQEYSLLPWRDVLDNVGLSLEMQGVKKRERRSKAKAALVNLGLEDFIHSYPHELSGGMRQRVAIARALATQPKILYMDEPFGALDAHTRLRMQQELLALWLESQLTIIFVTHSIEEAVFLASRIVVMKGNPGEFIEDIPNVLQHPRDRWSREFGAYCHHLLGYLDKESLPPEEDTSTPGRYAQNSCC